uniref:Transferase n=2 Tax=Macrostomum lignano TaxID=282301 RepID=A0A1I8JM83_9PLAT
MLVTESTAEVLHADLSRWSGIDPPEIPLSPIDSVMPPCYITAIYVFKNANGLADFMPFDLLSEGLKLAMVDFPDLNYRLKRNCTGDCVLVTENCGVRLVTANADFSAADLEAINFDPVRLPASLLDGSPADCGQFVCKFKLTRLSDNSVALGVLLHHNVMDGDGAFGFINRWAGICRELRQRGGRPAEPELQRPPVSRDRSVLKPDGVPSSVDHQGREYAYVEPQPAPEPEVKPTLPVTQAPQFTARLFHLSADFLARLKNSVNSEPGEQPAVQCTTNDCLVALLWRCVTKAKRLPADAPTKFAMACNARQRLSLPAGYAGNANFYIADQLTAGEVADGLSLASLARRVRAAVSRGTAPDYLRSILRWLAERPDRSRILPGFRMFANDLAFTSWVHFPVYEADFGWGRPLRFAVPSAGFDGLAVLMPRFDGDGYDVLTGCEVDAMDRLAAMPELARPT